jgi:putative hydrolase of HD superfamily
MAMVGAFSSSGVDTNRCIRMALVHDLAEATVGDITPHCGVSDQDKHAMELQAITKMTESLTLGGDANNATPGGAGAEILSLWKEYEEGTSEEAKLVKDMDKLEMILQALEYETDGKNGKSLDGFFDSTRGKWRTAIGEQWGREIEARRRKQEKTKQPEEKTALREGDEKAEPGDGTEAAEQKL